MRKSIASLAALTAMLSISSPSRAQTTVDATGSGIGYFVTSVSAGAITRLDLYKIGTDGVTTQVHENIFPDNTLNTFSASDYTVNTKTGKFTS